MGVLDNSPVEDEGMIEPHKRIPSIQLGEITSLAEQILSQSGRELKVWDYDVFHKQLTDTATTPEELMPYVVLTQLFPRCIAAVIDRSEMVSSIDKGPLILLVRAFPCEHTLAALYDWHPVGDSPWNDGLYDHVRMWTWTHCEICEVKTRVPS
jgi:hypothetical protein